MTDLPVLMPTSRKLYTWQVPGSPTRLRLRNGSVGLALIHLTTKIDRFVEDLDSGTTLDDWGYALRQVRGYAVMSYHSKGAAVDFNSLQHPLGVTRTFTRDEKDTIHEFLEMYDGLIRWGEDYHNRKDGMHIEFIGSLEQAEVLAKELLKTPIGRKVIRANPSQLAVIKS